MVIKYVYGWCGGKKVNARVQFMGVELIGRGGISWKVNQLFYAVDTLRIGNSRENPQLLLNEFDRVCKRKKLNVDAGKRKVIVCGKTERRECLDFGFELKWRNTGGSRFL